MSFQNGYKAQIVASSRESAVRYKKHLDAAMAAAPLELESLEKLWLRARRTPGQ